MAIAYETGGKSTTNWSSGTSKSTANFTISTGNLLIVEVCWTGGSSTLSTVKWNTSESCTVLTGATRTNTGGEKMTTYYLTSPTATTANVTVTIASAPTNGSIMATVYSGATTPLQGSNAAATGTSVTVSLTVGAGSWLHAACGAQRAPTVNVGVERQNTNTIFNYGCGDDAGSGATVTFGYNTTTQGVTYFEIPASGGAAANSNFFLFM